MDQNDDAEVLPLGQCSFCENHGCRELTDDEKEIGFARFAKKVTHACENDYQKNFVKYSFFNGSYCCDPLSLHKKRVPNKLTLITLQMHHLKKSLVPGKKLCSVESHVLAPLMGPTALAIKVLHTPTTCRIKEIL